MVRLARVFNTGSVVAIITGDEQPKCKKINEKLKLPATFLRKPKFVNVVIKSSKYFERNEGLVFNDLEDWALLD